MEKKTAFRLATYNIWGTGLPHRYWQERLVLRGAAPFSSVLEETDETVVWHRRRDLIGAALKSTGADLVALQEVTIPPGASESRAHELARQLGYRTVLSEPGLYGRLAVLSRRPVLSRTEYPLRSMAGAHGGHPAVLEVVVPTCTLWVVHIPVGPDEVRAACVAEVAAMAAVASCTGPLLVCGDFNCPTDGQPIRDLLDAGDLADSWAAAGGSSRALTMPLPEPTWRLDYILHRPTDAIEVLPGATLLGTEPDEGGLYASDHSGLLVEFDS